MSHHANISIFVPHIGCPNMCSFCNQRHITGTSFAPAPEDIDKAVQIAVKSRNYNPKSTEIAFFGGSFTAIEREYMLSLLKEASRFVTEGKAMGIRVSTRPDAINDEILEILKKYNVTSIELGAQSLSDKVLKMNNRGHSADDVIKSSELIKKYDISLGLQMMTGLYGDTDNEAISTAKGIIALRPDTVRIYPTIVLKDTDLANLYNTGVYKPQTVESAVKLASQLLMMFLDNNISVIRLGLHTIEQDSYVAGPWHPAFSELCQSSLMLENAKKLLTKKGNYIVYVNKSFISKMTGQKRCNIASLAEIGFDCCIKEDNSLKNFEMRIESAG